MKKSDLEALGRQWMERIRASEKREDHWIQEARKAEAAYLADDSEYDGGLPSFNILHSNVETIVPSIFNSSPTPDIRPRHNNRDEIGKAVSDILERAITTQVDDNALDQEIEASAQDAFMAGRGIVRVKFDADEVEAQVGVTEAGEEVEIAPAGITGERVLFEVVSWRDYREGPAKRWDAVPWVAYRHEISQEEKERLEDPEIAKAYDKYGDIDEDKDCNVWEVWDKEASKVYFIIEDSEKVLKIEDDPLGLPNFFPQAAPVQPITATGKRVPVCPYSVYEKLAKELDLATKRINGIMQGLKVRGVIAADASVLDVLATAGDNELVPVGNIENLVAAGGLDKAIMWWPVDKAIQVLQQLYVQRDQVKQSIYEITGISDIIRGQGAASETATAQQIKTEWGALRVKKMQRLIERQVRDLFVLTAEIICRHFSVATLRQVSGIQIDPQAAQMLQRPLDHYRIDVESDSTVRADLTKARSEMAEFLQGTAQFFATMQPVVAEAPQSAAPLAKMYAAFARQFALGKTAEDAIEEFVKMAEQAAQQPQGQEPSPEQQAMQAEMQLKMQEMQGKLELEMQKLQLQAQNLQMDHQIKRAELGIKQAELQIKNREAGIKGDALRLDEAKAEVDTVFKAQELDIEREQKRAAKIGNE